MNQQWSKFLESQSATISDSGEVSFVHGDQLTDCAIFDLTHLRLISITGADAVPFLQGQLTNDINQVSCEHHQMSSHCTHQGRMLANFRVFSHDGALILQLPADTKSALIKHLSMFVLRSQVHIEDVSDQMVAIGLAGEYATTLLGERFSQVPESPGADGMSLLSLPGHPPRYEIIGQAATIESMWKELSTQARATNHAIWSLLEIRAAIPTVYSNTAEAFVPQMLNMQLLDGVSFTKGCYVGQEVVARMRYLGELKRRMYLARADTERQPQPGDELFSDSGEQSGQGAGKVVMSAPSPQGGYELLAVVAASSYQDKTVHLEHASGPVLEFLPMPYTFDE
ncbi:MAG: folate-binding protein YgfZ [Gammaproteobacteria bacterium]